MERPLRVVRDLAEEAGVGALIVSLVVVAAMQMVREIRGSESQDRQREDPGQCQAQPAAAEYCLSIHTRAPRVSPTLETRTGAVSQRGVGGTTG